MILHYDPTLTRVFFCFVNEDRGSLVQKQTGTRPSHSTVCLKKKKRSRGDICARSNTSSCCLDKPTGMISRPTISDFAFR